MTTHLSNAFPIAVIAIAFAVQASAQAPKGPLSPTQKASAMIDGANLTVTYDAPSMRGREIFGKLVPYGSVWCPGANWATTIASHDAGIQIGSLKLPRGVYALWILPGKDEFELIVNSDEKAFHLNYQRDKDLGRMKLNLKRLDDPVEQLRWEIRPTSGNQATLALSWEKTEASIPITLLP